MPNKSISFNVQGDSGSDYDMDLLVDHDACRLVCSCPAGSIGMFCKHKQRILDGDFSRADISAADKREAKQILDQLNSKLNPYFEEINSIEEEIREAKARLKKAKNKAASALFEGVELT